MKKKRKKKGFTFFFLSKPFFSFCFLFTSLPPLPLPLTPPSLTSQSFFVPFLNYITSSFFLFFFNPSLFPSSSSLFLNYIIPSYLFFLLFSLTLFAIPSSFLSSSSSPITPSFFFLHYSPLTVLLSLSFIPRSTFLCSPFQHHLFLISSYSKSQPPFFFSSHPPSPPVRPK